MNAERKKVLIISFSLGEGGAEKICANIANLYSENGHTVTIGVLRPIVSYSVSTKISVVHLKKKRFLSNFLVMLRIRKLLRLVNPDVVVTMSHPLIILFGLSRLQTKKRYRWFARFSGNYPATAKCWETWIIRRLLTSVDGLILNSKGTKNAVCSIFNKFNQRRIHVLYNPCIVGNRKKATPRGHEAKKFVFAGRLVPEKRLDLLLDTFFKINNRVEGVTLTIFGEGPLRKFVKGEINRLGLDSVVELRGFCTSLIEKLLNFDVLLLTSERESLPNIVIEAQCLGLPVVATNCNFGPSEIITNNKTGFLVAVGDATEAARRSIELILDCNKYAQFSKQARILAMERFASDHLLNQWLALVEKRDFGDGE